MLCGGATAAAAGPRKPISRAPYDKTNGQTDGQ